jgi:hypothetical protein
MAAVIVVGTNSHITLADAETLMLERLDLDGIWSNASDIQKTAALIQASRQISNEILYGNKTDEDQLLAFPRDGETEVETEAEQATVEQAYWLLAVGLNASALAMGQGIRAQSAAGVSESYGVGSSPVICMAARAYLAKWWIATAHII